MAQCPYDYFEYEIQPGDTARMLSKRFSVSEQALRDRMGTEAKPGQRLRIPCGSGGCGQGAFYSVRRGETLLRIARRHGLTLADLLTANPYVNPNHVAAGQVIVIPVRRQSLPADIYTLGDGEGLFDVLRKFSMDVTSFCALNPGVSPMHVQPGQSVNVRQHLEQDGRWHTLEPQESLVSVAERFGLPVSALLSANERLRPSEFVPGMPVRIPG